MNNKKLMTFGIIGLFVMVLVGAAVVDYYGQKQVDMNIKSPIVFNGETVLSEAVELMAGDGFRLYLIEGENKLDRDVDVEFKFSLLQDGVELENTEGFYSVAATALVCAYARHPVHHSAKTLDLMVNVLWQLNFFHHPSFCARPRLAIWQVRSAITSGNAPRWLVGPCQ